MSPLGPRRPRSPGQRSFGPAGMGSPRDWHKVVHSPEVQRMLQDPQLAQALYQNYRMTGGQLPPGIPSAPPTGMQDGGPIPSPEEANRLTQMRGGDVDPETREELQMLNQQSRPGRPVRGFDQGGENMTDIQQEERQLDADERAARQKSDLKTLNEVIPAKRQKLQERKDALLKQQAQPAPGPVSLGNTQISGQTMAGLQKLQQQGPPTVGNMAMATGLGALMAGGGTGSGIGALIGAGTAGLLNYFIRKNAQQKKKPQDDGWSGSGGGGGGNYQPEPTGQPSPGGGGAAGAVGAPGAQNTPPPPPNAKGLWYGTSSAGNLKSYDQGKTWLKENEKPFTPSANDPVINQTQITADVAPQAATPTTTPTTTQPPDSDMTEGMGLAEGGPVPSHGGLGLHHMPIPVLHTTIVIAAKPKKGKGQSEEKPVEKKAMGGEIPQAARRARKPQAIPPVAGPNASGARLPRGRVQVPKGSGAAIRGKRFGGVF